MGNEVRILNQVPMQRNQQQHPVTHVWHTDLAFLALARTCSASFSAFHFKLEGCTGHMSEVGC